MLIVAFVALFLALAYLFGLATSLFLTSCAVVAVFLAFTEMGRTIMKYAMIACAVYAALYLILPTKRFGESNHQYVNRVFASAAKAIDR